LNALPVPVRAEYWNGSGFLTNGLDNCSTIGAISWVASSCTLTPTLSGVGSSLVSGQGTLMLAAPNVRGCADMSMAVPIWMRGRWDGVDQGADGNLYDDDPPARATFGVFKDKVLFRRENF
jgi:MSHA biogenesis protein MshQ